MTLTDIQKQLDETTQDPFKSMMVVYGCRAFALAMLAVLIMVRFILTSSPWLSFAALSVFSISFFIAGYVDARQYYKGQLWIAAQNLERMTTNLLSSVRQSKDSA